MDAVKELVSIAIIAVMVAYIGWIGMTVWGLRDRYRIACTCGYHRRASTIGSAQMYARDHMRACRGQAIAWPAPPAAIAEAHADKDTV